MYSVNCCLCEGLAEGMLIISHLQPGAPGRGAGQKLRCLDASYRPGGCTQSCAPAALVSGSRDACTGGVLQRQGCTDRWHVP